MLTTISPYRVLRLVSAYNATLNSKRVYYVALMQYNKPTITVGILYCKHHTLAR